MKRFLLAFMFVAMAVIGCKHTLEGPELTIEETELTYCSSEEQGFVVKGTGLSPLVVEGATDDATIDLPDVCLTRVADADGNPVEGEEEVCVPEEDVEWVSQEELHFSLHKDLGLSPGTYDVVIRNPDGTEVKGQVTLHVKDTGPLLLWADPRVVYNGISTQITLFGAALGDIEEVVLIDPDTEEEISLEFTAVGTRDNRLQAIVPMGTPVGVYDLVARGADCVSDPLVGGLTVTDTIGLSVTAIDPSFGWTDAATPVTITGADFTPVPRAYLNPTQPTADTVASGLTSVAFASDQRLTGIVPKGLPVGAYDLIVVDPDGRVGVLEGAFSVTADDPPLVTSVSPDYLANDGDKTVTIDGQNFRDPSVTLMCRAPDGTETELMGSVVGDATATTFDAVLPVGSLVQGTVCIVRVTNSDGSYYDYSAIGISNPSSNLNEFQGGPSMITARRAPAVAAARATNAARFIYAIGGDDGSPSGALATVETTGIDIFGEPGEWFQQPVSLPSPRTLAGVVTVGRFLYLVGGNDGSGPTASVLRAEVLDPLAAPEIVDVAARPGEDDSEGIGSGVWYYRVSAVMADDDPSNPGGETLASDPLVVSLPDSMEGTLVLTLIWEPVPGAKAYRIYRNRTGDLPVGSEQRVAEVDGGDATTYEDTAPPGGVSGDPPLPLGATGVWIGLPDLGTAREAAGVAAQRDPQDATQWHVYAVGGRDGGDLASWEWLTTTIADDGSQTFGTWNAGSVDLSAGRSELTAFAVSHHNAVQVPVDTHYVYAGGGEGSTDVEVAEVAPGGDLVVPGGMTSGWLAVDAMSPQRSGYAGLAGAGFLFAFGGAQGGPSDSNSSSEIDPGNQPALLNWNNEGVRLVTPRYLAGGAVESAFIYIVGGATDGGVTASTERTVL